MDQPALTSLLNQGIAAIKAGDKARGRALLLQVVEADDRVEPAWFWLSAALDDPGDQLVALENVLTLNPGHVQAQAGVRALRQRLGLAAAPAHSLVDAPETAGPSADPAAPAPSPVGVEPRAPPATLAAPRTGPGPFVLAGDDDPDQCAYCGRPVGPEAARCPHCGRSLLTSGSWRPGGYQYLLLIMVGLHLQASMLQGLAAYLQANFPDSLKILPWGEILALNPLLPAVIRVVAWAVVLMMLLNDSQIAYASAAGLGVLDLGWAGAGWAWGGLAKELAAIVAILAGSITLTGISAAISQAQARRLLRVVPDRGISSGVMFHRRAEHYARRGQWALAALHWQRAIARQPREPLYYKVLGKAQVRLGRHASAVKTFRSGAELAPHDPDFPRLIESVRAYTRNS